MKAFFDKVKVPFAVIFSAVIIISIAAVVCAVISGVESGTAAPTETISVIDDDNLEYKDVLKFDDREIYLPENFDKAIESVTLRTCKTYTEKELTATDGNITVRAYNYAYLIEDDVIIIPDNAQSFQWHDIEVFAYENSDGTSTAIYYKELVRYEITVNGNIENLRSYFN